MSYHHIDMTRATDEFRKIWSAAGQHIEMQTEAGSLSWLKANLQPPFLEHLSFRIGNQLFFIRVIDAENKISGPGSIQGLMEISERAQGVACLLPMLQTAQGWRPTEPGWGLVGVRSGKNIDPLALVSDEEIRMSDWELQDFAVQVVRNYLDKENKEILSTQSNPEVNPSLWFVDDQGPSWVVVKPLRYPESTATLPDMNGLEKAGKQMSAQAKGYIAWVKVANASDPFDPDAKNNNNYLELLRGHGCYVSFEGLTPLRIN